LKVHVNIYPLGGVWGDQQPHILFWDPLYIYETNRARKLKFGTLVGIYESARGRPGDQQPPTPPYLQN